MTGAILLLLSLACSIIGRHNYAVAFMVCFIACRGLELAWDAYRRRPRVRWKPSRTIQGGQDSECNTFRIVPVPPPRGGAILISFAHDTPDGEVWHGYFQTVALAQMHAETMKPRRKDR